MCFCFPFLYFLFFIIHNLQTLFPLYPQGRVFHEQLQTTKFLKFLLMCVFSSVFTDFSLTLSYRKLTRALLCFTNFSTIPMSEIIMLSWTVGCSTCCLVESDVHYLIMTTDERLDNTLIQDCFYKWAYVLRKYKLALNHYVQIEKDFLLN